MEVAMEMEDGKTYYSALDESQRNQKGWKPA